MSITEQTTGQTPGAAEAVRPAPSTLMMSGVDALVRLLVVRHQLDEREGLSTGTMVSGYPGSPLGTFDLTLDAFGPTLADHGVLHRPGVNEELAVATVWGSQMGASVAYEGVDGVAGAWYGKSPGLDRAGDAIKHANAMGAGPNGGVVMFCGDDPSAKSSTLTCDSQHTFEDACIPVFAPGDQQDVIDLGVHAFGMSRYAGVWAGMKIVTSVADGIGTVDIALERLAPEEPVGVVIDGRTWRHEPLSTVGPHYVPNQELLVSDLRLQAAQAYVRHNGLDRVVGAGPGARLGIVCAGKTYFDVVQAFADLGVPAGRLADIGVRILKLAMTWPIVPDTAVEFAESVDELLVVEEKRPFVETQLRALLHERGVAAPLTGRRDRSGNALRTVAGELGPTPIAKILVTVLPELAPPAPEPAPTAARALIPLLELPARPPAFCSGCPHNRSTVFPDGALVGGGVGCHGMIYFEPRHRGMKSLPPAPMGGEGVPWIGLSPFVGEPHLIQNLGDGTLSHSGTLAIRASVAAGVNVTYKILYNQAVAMTGGQDIAGIVDVPALTRELDAEGVAEIVVCAEDPDHYGKRARWAPGVTVLPRDRLDEVQTRLRTVPGTTVIVYDQQCAAEARRLRSKGLQPTPPRRVVINEAVCEGCGDCSTKSNCLSVLPLETEFGEKRQIDDLSCNRDYTCLDGDCPSFVTIVPKDPDAKPATRGAERPKTASRPSLPSGTLPNPQPPAVDGRYSIYVTGIGGTGIITATRTIAAAAENAGFHVGGVDQTGLSQKAGAVVSHLQLAKHRDDLGSPTVSSAHADLYLSGDILQAAGAAHLDKVAPGRTVAVVDSNVTPTGAMLQTGEAPPAVERLEAAIAQRIGADRSAFVDSKRIASEVFANQLLANIVLLGAAFQLGGLPVSMDDIETSIRGRRKGAEDNLAAFTWGRWAAHDPAAVEAALAAVDSGGADAATSILDPSAAAVERAERLVATRRIPADLRHVVLRRAAQVVDYQHASLAARFVDLVEQAAAHDDGTSDWALTRAVVESWFKLLTYKDEYEVARLHLKTDFDRVARDLGIDGDYSVTFHLHPPMLRRLGLHRKLPMGKTYEASFRVLRRMKRLRGTWLDPFRFDPDRRTERALIAEYHELVVDTLAGLDPSDRRCYDAAVELAGSPMSIKGYADIKERAVAEWRSFVAARRR